MNRKTFLTAAIGAAFALTGLGALADTYPSKPITMIIPFPPGGTLDTVGRAVATRVGQQLGQTIVVENRAGGAGTIGGLAVKQAKADGYTLLFSPSTHVTTPLTMKTAPYDAAKDFTPIALVAKAPLAIAVNKALPVTDVKSLIAHAKANPGKLTFGSSGLGTTPHLAMEEFAYRAGIQLQHIPYKGFADGMQAMLGGHTMAHSDSTGWAPHVEAGTARLLATYGSKRAKRFSSAPTLNELGYETISDSPFGIGGPKGMDPEITRRLHDAFRKTLDDPAVLATFEKFDQTVIYMNTEDYTRWIAEQVVKEKAVIQRLGLMMKG